MDQKSLVSRLNWFYSLEVTQVDSYLAQSKAVDDPYIASGLERVAMVEQDHVDNLSRMIINMGAKPSLIGDVLSPLVGTALGKVLGTTDLATMLQLDIKIEAKAAADYNKLIGELEAANHERGMVKTLKYNMTDEDLHSAWFAGVIQQLDSGRRWPLSPILDKQMEKNTAGKLNN